MKLFFSYFLLISSIFSEDTCQIKDDKGYTYDLSKLTKNNEDYKVVDPDTKTEFFLNICHGVTGSSTGLKNPDETAAYYKDDSTSISIGEPSKKLIKHDDHLVLNYKNGAACPNGSIRKSTAIIFTCDHSVSGNGQPTFVSQPSDCDYIFYWGTPLACSTNTTSGGGGGRSGFSTFMIVISSLFFGYLILGILYNRFKNGAKGLDQLPHKRFWFDCYDFIKDMSIILLAKCGIKPKSSNNQYLSVSHHEQHVLINDDLEEL